MLINANDFNSRTEKTKYFNKHEYLSSTLKIAGLFYFLTFEYFNNNNMGCAGATK